MKKILYILLLFVCSNVNSQTNKQSLEATMREAYQYLNGFIKPLDPAKAFELFMQCAEKGNAKAMNAVGVQYRAGLGTTADHSAAFKWFKKAAEKGYGRAWYNLGAMYKYGNGCTLDYGRAYACFSKASTLNEPSGWYAEGYMLYKGLGCNQDYKKAIMLFRKGAEAGRPSCMYFLGLCLRNGFGTIANTDSAYHWLEKAAAFGYDFAKDELAVKEPENDEVAKSLAAKLKTQLVKALPGGTEINKYTRIEQSVPALEIEGSYTGYLVKYDYSGQHVLTSSKLNLNLSFSNGQLHGLWTEDDSTALPLHAFLTPRALVFSKMQYRKNDHYNRSKALLWNFEKATLKLVKSNDSVYLAGNLQVFSPDSKEPEKPLFVALVRTGSTNTTDSAANINYVNDRGEVFKISNNLQAYPNPFTGILNIEFEVKETCNVYVQLLSIDGKIVYNNAPAKLTAGNYTLPIQPNIPAGNYIVRLYCGKQVKSTVVIKQ